MCGEIIETDQDQEIVITCNCEAVETYRDDNTGEDVININTNKVSQKTLPINCIVETDPDKFVYTKTYNKLVRDYVPEILKSKGDIPSYIVITNVKEIISLLEDKLNEEYNEYENAETVEQQIEEIGDLIEVLFSLAEQKGYTRVELTNLMIKKNLTKGQFNRGVFLVDVTRQGKEIE
jgi:predicted house-cleaning noncanonical NTP pyrophosphatase (MazG superfamily)